VLYVIRCEQRFCTEGGINISACDVDEVDKSTERVSGLSACSLVQRMAERMMVSAAGRGGRAARQTRQHAMRSRMAVLAKYDMCADSRLAISGLNWEEQDLVIETQMASTASTVPTPSPTLLWASVAIGLMFEDAGFRLALHTVGEHCENRCCGGVRDNNHVGRMPVVIWTREGRCRSRFMSV
jgi:hypothetical protein